MNNSPLALVVHVVPQLPPVICGVGDYAALVGGQVQKLRPSLRSGYVACGCQPETLPLDQPGCRNVTGACDGAQLWRAVDSLAADLGAKELTLVIHYSGYGYDPSGAPGWLARALENRPGRFGAARIVTMFHELYANGWPWQKAFWNSSRQRCAAVRVARVSDGLMTNRSESARWLETVTGRAAGSVASMPVISNIGEPQDVLQWEARAPYAVAFGGPRFKRSFLQGSGAKATAALCRKLGLRKIVDIGAAAGPSASAFRENGIEVVETGYLAAAEVSGHFQVARAALVDYFSGYFGKSGVLAAAAAHGTPPIFPIVRKATDGLRFGEHLWDLDSAEAANRENAFARLSAISRAVRHWYEGHNLERHAEALAGTS